MDQIFKGRPFGREVFDRFLAKLIAGDDEVRVELGRGPDFAFEFFKCRHCLEVVSKPVKNDE